MEKEKTAPLAGAVGILSALGVGSCCVLPLFFVTLGMGGSWIGNIASLAPYQSFFLIFSFLAIGFGFWQVFRPEACGPDGTCATTIIPRPLTIFLLFLALIMTLTFWLFPLWVSYF